MSETRDGTVVPTAECASGAELSELVSLRRARRMR
jgi:hypothetical protein